jgi:hypothetical protein
MDHIKIVEAKASKVLEGGSDFRMLVDGITFSMSLSCEALNQPDACRVILRRGMMAHIETLVKQEIDTNIDLLIAAIRRNS